MESVVLITSERSSGHIRITTVNWAGVLAIALLSTAGCSVNGSRQTPLRPPVVVADVRGTPRDAEACKDERPIEAPTVERLGYRAAYYGALLRLPDESVFWCGAAQCDDDR
jgi:hypothetical protein